MNYKLNKITLEFETNKKPDGIFYIKNTIDEWHDDITGYFYTLDEAIKALEECSDWYRDKGTGTIYYQKFGLGKIAEKIYEL